ncbi:MAG: SDR family oxidoreductase [Thermoplasmata archaeon]|nr:SDR family oxidoreductase [Thermoplasmata archaeon]
MTSENGRPVAVVTGASRGLGSVVANFLAGSGYDLVATARASSPLHEAARPWERLGATVVPVSAAVEDSAGRAAIQSAVHTLGRLDVVVHNASELGPSGRPKLLALSPDQLETVLRVNVVAPVLLTKALLPPLKAAPAALVVNITSDAAVGAYPGWGAYGASKAALDLVTRTLAQELADDHVSVVSVDPGDMRTAMHQAAYLGEDISDRPLPEVTVPFWAWLFGQSPARVNGLRFQAQGERWEANP